LERKGGAGKRLGEIQRGDCCTQGKGGADEFPWREKKRHERRGQNWVVFGKKGGDGREGVGGMGEGRGTTDQKWEEEGSPQNQRRCKKKIKKKFRGCEKRGGGGGVPGGAVIREEVLPTKLQVRHQKGNDGGWGEKEAEKNPSNRDVINRPSGQKRDLRKKREKKREEKPSNCTRKAK